MSLKCGSLVYTTDSGLGLLAKSFYDHGLLTDVMVVRHGRHHMHDEWYPKADQITDLRSHIQQQDAKDFCASMDVMLFFETPFLWELLPYCKDKGVKTVLMPMYECMPERLPDTPDLFINPSLLDQQYYPQGVFVPVPVEMPWKLRTKAEVFVHNAGHGGLKGRNGTTEITEAWKHVNSSAVIKIYSQSTGHDSMQRNSEGGRLEIIYGTRPYGSLFNDGDVFLFPEKFNGLSLPLQEARASGMLVMCGDRLPMNSWLPREYLIPPSHYTQNRIGPPYNVFDEAHFSPEMIAHCVDTVYGTDITDYSLSGKLWAETMSWKRLGPVYREILEGLRG